MSPAGDSALRLRRQRRARLRARLQRLAAGCGRDSLRTTVGVDLVSVGRVAESLRTFGSRFTARLFTDAETAYAMRSPGQAAQRLAARFAAKEAALKAIGLTDVGVCWRDIEVERGPAGGGGLRLLGRAPAAAADAGLVELALSLTHEDDSASAVVLARLRDADAAARPHRYSWTP
ncbi:MAG: 4'-phosphopantetheinyl transferase superfamily protein [Burkholderiaceae bacterium]